MKPPVASPPSKKSIKAINRIGLSVRFSLAIVSFLYTAVHEVVTPKPAAAVVRQYTFSGVTYGGNVANCGSDLGPGVLPATFGYFDPTAASEYREGFSALTINPGAPGVAVGNIAQQPVSSLKSTSTRCSVAKTLTGTFNWDDATGAITINQKNPVVISAWGGSREFNGMFTDDQINHTAISTISLANKELYPQTSYGIYNDMYRFP